MTFNQGSMSSSLIILYWQGKEYKRDSKEYQDLLDRAYFELSKNEKFQKALLSTGNSTLTHSMGKHNINETVLTEREFISRLYNIRKKLQSEIK